MGVCFECVLSNGSVLWTLLFLFVYEILGRNICVLCISSSYTVNPQIKTGIQLEAGLQIVAGGVVDTDK